MPQVLIDFNIDEQKVAENAEKEAGRLIANKVIDTAFGSYNRDSAMRKYGKYVENVIREIIEPEKDKIINEAIKEVVANLHRTKVVKEMLADAADSN